MKFDLTALEQARLLVVGDVMLDRYWHGGTSRISPEAPVPVVKVNDGEDRPGGAANVALNIASLGAHAALAGLVGDDENANLLTHRLEDSGVSTHFQRSPEIPTIAKLRVMSRNQQLIRLDFEQALDEVDTQDLHDRVAAQLGDADLVILSDYGKGTLNRVESLIQMVRDAGKRVLVDPKGSDFRRYRGASVVTPNLTEFEAVAGPCRTDEELAAKGEALRDELDLEALLITRSEKGMTLIRADHAPLHLPTRAREVYDVTGAGDTVIGVLGLALAAGHGFPEAMTLSNLAAGLVVAKPGTATLSIAELYTALHGDKLAEFGLIEAAPLVEAVRAAQARGEKVVMTNGCFDILHAGHVAYLEQARLLGDRLIVAVNDDASIARLKGPTRPINPLKRRMQVLAGLGAVDWVVPFSEDTPASLIETVLPDVLVKGGDYQPADIAGGEAVIANGGEVRVLDFEDGVSTTAMISTILDRER
ncbi:MULTISPECIES: bifunctional D-glycero-beta-D-manno-heptose-7-phosphate kinase/D-glycero-beta-D-manno-heptose 1-phosphate adenylyltransferase HldE [Halomonadaceae]|uniref:bifunctional D-glycero-beta-D-manno-heptose-7-phosphate kinase/D-glycero-beta-D-manno-heptose 1-phosphate adenylyltransferase HldE n=1 Tax=Halomonadaceae TaxID=28256 RepID=UPI001581F68D|nr:MULTISPECIES: bifunctional D-glycero-beta-D-manno-heptose-7-phosphate kinase/D-glycero-beta-D-manno-heptose 1-phosphate adenylyltransferase HldE [Halomonas]MDI4636431.1 bifunctional D-glycero-beta-D-manno-heptose-7-phosphate kinase/D-glycero-beta-D-manno-heptose 1-phosphate adenylyltransferase HldE [Halomonas sp. BMC7]NUJ60796.1 bifunctional D-glycero-beta-D-manno-heptose-7-phosphate kinase/D-glycero-beta-D-manno-heptose 1-phosphate adenylyltransferase HldE [Halomonas taeanensis]|tara:strand:+ start:19877 stop:21307 length:1431 start_codon:yes stop_codon:yes gene_type:complete